MHTQHFSFAFHYRYWWSGGAGEARVHKVGIQT
jgi:hypothetical protein